MSLPILFLSRNAEVEYNIIGKCLQMDPHENVPDTEYVTYIPWKWLSVPVKLWIPNANLGALLCICSSQLFFTWAFYYTSPTNSYNSSTLENGCVQVFLRNGSKKVGSICIRTTNMYVAYICMPECMYACMHTLTHLIQHTQIQVMQGILRLVS